MNENPKPEHKQTFPILGDPEPLMVQTTAQSQYEEKTTGDLIRENKDPHSSYQKWQATSHNDYFLFPKTNPHTGEEWSEINCIKLDLSEDELWNLTAVKLFHSFRVDCV